MQYTITIANPEYVYSGGVTGKVATDVPISNLRIVRSFEAVSTLSFMVRSDVTAIYSLETDDTNNPVQANSIITIKEGANYYFRGYIFAEPIFRTVEAGVYIEVECRGWDGILLDSLCPDASGNYIWSLETDKIEVVEVPLQATNDYGTFRGSTLWPDPLPADADGAKCYVAGATDALDANISDSDTTIVLSTTTKGFVPRGWVQIESEWIYFDGYDNSNVDTKYRLYNCVRGQLGTTAAAHVATTTVTERLGKQIAPAKIKLENDPGDGDGYRSLRRRNEYEIVESLGCFVLSATDSIPPIIAVNQLAKEYTVEGDYTAKFKDGDYFTVQNSTGNDGAYRCDGDSSLSGTDTVITTVGAIPDATVDGNVSRTGNYRGTYSVYDEDGELGGSTVISLADVIEKILQGPLAYGGCGFEAADMDLTGVAGITINRYDYDEQKPQDAFSAIQDLLKTVGLANEVKLWYKHTTGKFVADIIVNSASSFTLPNVSRIEEQRSLEDIYSFIRVQYTDDQDINLCAAERSYHQEATGVGQSPDEYWAVSDYGDGWDFPASYRTVITAAGNGGMDMTVDGQPKTKLGAMFTHAPADTVEFGHYWFDDAVAPIHLDRIKIRINHYRVIGDWQSYQNADATYVIRIEGCTDYETTGHTGTWVDLGCQIEAKPDVNGTWVEVEFTSFALRTVNAIRVVWDYMAGPKETDEYYAVIHDIEVNGSTIKYVTCQLTDDTAHAGDPAYLIAPESFVKLRGGIKAASATGGCQRSTAVNIGAASAASALSIARLMLLSSLRMYGQRRYYYQGELPSTPELGLTITCNETTGVTYTGTLREFILSVDEGITSVDGVVLSTATDVIA